MYGLLIEGVCEALKKRFGAEKWNAIRERAGVTQHAFVTHDRYSEAIVQRLARATTELTDMQMTQVMELCGMSFVDLLTRYVIVLFFFFFRISPYHIVNSVYCSHAVVSGPTSKRPASDGGLCGGQLLMM